MFGGEGGRVDVNEELSRVGGRVGGGGVRVDVNREVKFL